MHSYDKNNRLVRSVNGVGNGMVCGYDPAGNLMVRKAITAKVCPINMGTSPKGLCIVTGQSLGIDCGNICTNQFQRGQSVKLTAVPASDYQFRPHT